jgi:hypothetical protein
MKAEITAGQEEMKEDLLARWEAKIEANQAKTDIKLKEINEEIKSGEA